MVQITDEREKLQEMIHGFLERGQTEMDSSIKSTPWVINTIIKSNVD